MKYLYLIICLFATAAFATTAQAGGWHQHATPEVTQTTASAVDSAYHDRFAAMAAMAGIDFDMGNNKNQVRASIGGHESSTGYAVGFGRNIDGVLLHGTIGDSFDGGATTWNAGIGINF